MEKTIDDLKPGSARLWVIQQQLRETILCGYEGKLPLAACELGEIQVAASTTP